MYYLGLLSDPDLNNQFFRGEDLIINILYGFLIFISNFNIYWSRFFGKNVIELDIIWLVGRQFFLLIHQMWYQVYYQLVYIEYDF